MTELTGSSENSPTNATRERLKEPDDIAFPGDDAFTDLELNDEAGVIAAVYQDLRLGLQGIFEPDGDHAPGAIVQFRALGNTENAFPERFRLEPGVFSPPDVETQPILSDDQAAVAWVYDTVNGGEFFGLTATHRHVRLRGITILRPGAEKWSVYRSVDWLDALGQMGVAVSGRSVPLAVVAADGVSARSF